METFWQDVRYGIRMLAKSPGFAAVALLTLAIGIGANTAIFSVLNAVLLRPLPYANADRVVLLWGADIKQGTSRDQVSFPDVVDWRAQNHVFDDIAAFTGPWTPVLSGTAEPERIHAAYVGDGFFYVLGAKPLLGRVFLPEEQIDGKDYEVVLDYRFWKHRFGGDPQIVGRTIALDSKLYTIVGVMPADFPSLPTRLLDDPAEIYRPAAEKYEEKMRSGRHLRALALLKPNVSIEQAQAEMTGIARRLEQQHPDSNTDYTVRVTSLREDLVGYVRPTLLLLFGAVGCVLLITCVNVANLLLSRATSRQKEIAIRAALGAGQARLVRQFLTESLLLALVGGGFGFLCALWGTSWIGAAGSQVVSSLNGVEMDLRVLTFTVGVSLLAGLIFGLVPALRVSRPDLNESLKEGGRTSSAGSSGNRLRSVLVISELAMAVVLLVAAGLMIKSLLLLRAVSPGFNPASVLSARLGLPDAKYKEDSKKILFYRQLVERVGGIPGVQSTALVTPLPLSLDFDTTTVEIEGQPDTGAEQPDTDRYTISPGYLRAMQVPLLEGRAFTEQDTEDTPGVVLVSETMARAVWPNQDPLGKRVKLPGDLGKIQGWRTVVGVVADVKQYGLDAAPTRQIYLPHAQYPVSWMSLVVRTVSEPARLIPSVRTAVRSLDADEALSNVATFDQLLADSLAVRRFSMLLLGAFAALALVLASVGIYGVISYSVTQRTHEIGIRLALGAGPGDVLALVLGQGARFVAVGLLIGLTGAVIISRIMVSLLFGVSATDPFTFAGVATLLAVVALLACYVPARRAMRVDPMVALRYE